MILATFSEQNGFVQAKTCTSASEIRTLEMGRIELKAEVNRGRFTGGGGEGIRGRGGGRGDVSWSFCLRLRAAKFFKGCFQCFGRRDPNILKSCMQHPLGELWSFVPITSQSSASFFWSYSVASRTNSFFSAVLHRNAGLDKVVIESCFKDVLITTWTKSKLENVVQIFNWVVGWVSIVQTR